MTANKLNGLGFTISDEMVSCILLARLPEKYKLMIMGLENSGLKISIDIGKTKILQEVVGPSGNGKSSDLKRYHNYVEAGHFAKDCPKKS